MKKVFSFRLDEELVLKARKNKLNVKDLIEKSLEKTLKERTCPTCKRQYKGK